VNKVTYKEAGVDVKLGDEASKILYEAAKKTFQNREGNIGEVIIPYDDFSGVRAINISGLPDGSLMCMGFDGVGTKTEIAQRMNKHDTIAFDLLAMVCDDAIVRGAEPVLVGSVLDVNSLMSNEIGSIEKNKIEAVRQMAVGYVDAAKAANVAVINGELAELGKAVGGHGEFCYSWSAAVVWFVKKEKMLTGREIKVGDAIVAFEEKGFRSNGLSLVRKIFEKKYGEEWHNAMLDCRRIGEHVLEPSTIYSKAVVRMHGGFKTTGSCKIHGVCHITGGGIPCKIGRVLKPSGYGAELDNLFDPCTAMLHCQKSGNVEDEEAYKTWNMGQGLMIITPEPSKVIEEAERCGIKAKIAGRIVGDKGIKLRSRGVFSCGSWLSF
jgi:phosphoribosylformylglycinamidine cyclo-ligase